MIMHCNASHQYIRRVSVLIALAIWNGLHWIITLQFAETLSPLIKLLFREGEKGVSTKWNLLIWALSLTTAASSKIRNVPHEYLVTVLALTFMVQVSCLFHFH